MSASSNQERERAHKGRERVGQSGGEGGRGRERIRGGACWSIRREGGRGKERIGVESVLANQGRG